MGAARMVRPPGELPQTMRIEAQATGGGDARVFLTQRAGGGVARVGKGRSSGVLLLVVQGVEVIPAHEHFASDFHEVRNVFLGAAEVGGNGADGSHIQGDVFAGNAVAARQALFKHAVAIDEVQGEAVDFDLAAHGQGLGFGPIKVANHRIVPILELFDGEDVIKAHHAAGVAHGGEVVGEGAADAMGGRLRIVQ